MPVNHPVVQLVEPDLAANLRRKPENFTDFMSIDNTLPEGSQSMSLSIENGSKLTLFDSAFAIPEETGEKSGYASSSECDD